MSLPFLVNTDLTVKRDGHVVIWQTVRNTELAIILFINMTYYVSCKCQYILHLIKKRVTNAIVEMTVIGVQKCTAHPVFGLFYYISMYLLSVIFTILKCDFKSMYVADKFKTCFSKKYYSA